MKTPYNIYCFRLSFTDNCYYFYRCAAHSKEQAYMKMIKEILHDTNLTRRRHLNDIHLIHTIVDSDNDKRFIQGLNIAADKYYKFIHNYERAAIQQFYYLNTHCHHLHCGAAGDYCTKYKKGCCMDKGIYCKAYTKGRDLNEP